MTGVQTCALPISEHGEILIKRIEQKVVSRPVDNRDTVRIRLRLSQNSQPVLSLDGKFIRSPPPPRVEFRQAWINVLGSLAPYWDEDKEPPALLTTFDQLKENERGSFATDLSLSDPQVSGLGHFDNTVVRDVPIAPRTKQDATRWAEWLLLRSVNTYQNKNRYAKLVEEVRSKFPDYRDIVLPSQARLAEDMRRRNRLEAGLPEEYWYLQAPLDLDGPSEIGES